MSEIKISIVIPFYSRHKLLKETLISIKAQTFESYEVIIVDDHSDEFNFSEATKIVQELDDNRFNLFKKPSHMAKGANVSRNYGYNLAKGEFIKWFDSDDLMASNFLNIQYKDITNTNYDGVLASCGVYDSKFENKIKDSWRNKIFSKKPIVEYLRGQLAWQTGAGLWRKSSLATINPFSQDLSNAQEYIFHFYTLTENFKIGIREEELFHIRSHSQSISKKRDENYLKNRYKSRLIALNRIYYTRNSGKRYLIKSIIKMISEEGRKDKLSYCKMLIENLKLKRCPSQRKAILHKIR
ncbi:glycosyltransferase [Salegentibacter sp. BLCTC]|uniref:glycosyltransferase family 2 protein n=1 Tax=Salegentibacter sp. BLCTC TaxID=2697368 RepID=UPI00187B430C|nr:glycosyltransferase family 2 protein [Salegentibacter sp. BLCTC]MBE7639220.1 glycosyltransferase [Salegentibacter sp. BLCTC]